MRTICLSDHIGDQIRRYEAGRLQSQAHLRSEYVKAKARKRAAFWKAAADILRSGARLRVRKFVESVEDLMEAVHAPLPFKATVLRKGEKESVWISGQEGEERVLRKLRKICSRSCTALLGYNGPKGEIDIVLVGRYGVTAIEVKNYAGEIGCDGDLWWRTRGGDTEEIHDATGRSPSVQLTDCANELQATLIENGFRIPVRRLVVLAHPTAVYGDRFSPSVNWACKVEHLRRRILFDSKLDEPLDRDRIECVCDVIVARHDQEANRRAVQREAETHSPLFEASYFNVERGIWRLPRLTWPALIFGGLILLAIIRVAFISASSGHSTDSGAEVSAPTERPPAKTANRQNVRHANGVRRNGQVMKKSQGQTTDLAKP